VGAQLLTDARDKAERGLDEAKREEKERTIQLRRLEEHLLEREATFDKRLQSFEKKEKDIMKQKPKDYSSSLFTGEMKVLIFIIGVITDLFLLGLFFWLLKYSGYEIAHIRTVIFAALTIDSLFYIFSCKSLRKSVWQIKFLANKFLLAFWALGVAMLLLAIYLPFLQGVLKTTALSLFDWELILGLGIIHIFLIEGTKYYFVSRSTAKKEQVATIDVVLSKL